MWYNGSKDLVATITPHHLLFDRRWTTYQQDGACMPIVKASSHTRALQALVKDGCEWVHLGTDCAPHPESKKQAVSTACGCFTGPHAIALYLMAFEMMGCLERFEEFASIRGPRFFGFEPAGEDATYKKRAWRIDSMVEMSDGGQIRPFLYRTAEEVTGGATNLTLTWQKAA